LIARDAVDSSEPDGEIRPNWALVLAGTVAIALISAGTLPWALALTSTALGALMVAGADIDARTFLLPDVVTFSTLACGLGAALVLDPLTPWPTLPSALARAATAAGVVAALRFGYVRARGVEGIGLGDVKLAGGIGAWLPLEQIPICFALATGAALLYALHARWRGLNVHRTTQLPFGAFLCPALWLVFYSGVVAG
jgi:leader peptidase (prepilin peptidase)/N-methyltransferase